MIEQLKIAEFIGDCIRTFAQNKGYEVINEKGIEGKLNSLADKLLVMSERIDDSIIREHVLDYIERYLYQLTSLNPILPDAKTSEFVDKFKSQYHSYLGKDNQDVLVSCIKTINEDIYSILNNSDLIILRTIENGIEDIKGEFSKGFNLIDKKLDNMMEAPERTLKSFITKDDDTKFQNNLRNEYAEKWNDVLFLHRNQPIEKQVRLRDVYIFPDYKLLINDGIQKYSNAYNDLENFMDYFIKSRQCKPVIILGDGGMGKSSLIYNTCHRYPDEKNLIVVRFKNLNRKILNTSGICGALERELECNREDFRNKCLILDGFDEAKVDVNRDKLLMNFLVEATNIRNFNVIVTTRQYYINEEEYTFCKVMQLQFLSERLIDFVCKKYAIAMKEKPMKIENANEVSGIPFILYMILTLKVSVKKDTELYELYGTIFSLNGGIYDRLYDEGMHWISIPEMKTQLHLISQKIAFAMFEKNSLDLSEAEYLDVVSNVCAERTNDFAIANYYNLGTTLSFIHKSIYEYFVAEYMYQSIKSVVTSVSDNKQIIKCLIHIFKGDELTIEIINCLRYKIKNDKNIYTKKNYETLKMAINSMLEYGMVSGLDKVELDKLDKHILHIEAYIFSGIMHLISCFHILNQEKYIKLEGKLNEEIRNAGNIVNLLDLRNINLGKEELRRLWFKGSVDLRGANLKDADLSWADLSSAELCGANLCGATLKSANLRGRNLSGSALCGAILCGADLNGAKLQGADLSSSDLRRLNLSRVDLREVDLKGAKLDEKNVQLMIKNMSALKVKNLEKVIVRDMSLYNYLEYYAPEVIKRKFHESKQMNTISEFIQAK